MNNPACGRFITLEGGEGTGKSTLQSALRDRLAEQGIDAVLTREPGGTARAEAIRALVLNPPGEQAFSPLAEALLMNAARSDHLDGLIRPALTAGKWVICDRFSDSTRVYQGVTGDVSPAVLLDLENHVVGSTRPDLTLILDAPINIATERRSARQGVEDVFENRDKAFHQAVRLAFSDIARREPERCQLIDASRSAPEVADAAWHLISQRFIPAAVKG
ncbi:MAG: dTMP kinase [Hyphomonas sp.]|uniref:dTMP kinase n=1 Tax=Hyphomonas sp. TaxID=87 RepID=UPI001853438D|nr:dTMP kinase [Hyphomonas sp.]MBU3918973.1 dTMP kinase [Alphaproteobacteria bacterium]MBA3069710.1 dTMP kinase [Hyphomonas sp.]MBU4062551.1 dTMP kinase [Alphaproteobacteria bacterium]MBU4163902.1 dTMP kinase [Alphaproteobacteria bacterium]MBU4569070.1 dTMP kinase [Alphaproteobacteria bacterium]